MFSNTLRTKSRPKILSAIDNSIYNDAPPTPEILSYTYRKIFKLSYEDYLKEPSTEFFTNLYIYSQINKKQELEAKHGS